MSDYARQIIGLDRLVDAAKWTGSDEVIAIVDSGIDATHPDFDDRITQVKAVEGASETDQLGHGTHVAGIAAGSGAASDGKVRGMAPSAGLAVLGIVGDGGRLMLPPDIGTLLHRAADMGAKIINLSWGTPVSGAYENGAMAVDTFVRERPDVLVVIAAGNEGSAPSGEPILYTIGTPASAKNALTVGACCTSRPDFPQDTWGAYKPAKFPAAPLKDGTLAGDPNLPAALSSRGPTDTESVGPNLLAPGTAILAPRAKQAMEALFWRPCPDHGGRYGYMNGTSMAAPVVSGAAAVMRQYAREALGVKSPSAALLKAMLVACADRLPWSRAPEEEEDYGYPDFDQGYGRLNLTALLPGVGTSPKRKLIVEDVPNDADHALEARAPAGAKHKAVRSWRLKVIEGATEPLRIVLAWSDYSVAGIQNDLNFMLQCPDARRIVGNDGHRWLLPKAKYLDPRLHGTLMDRRNNVERIDVPAPPAGAYRLRLIAENTLFPPQGYALCVCGELDGGLEPEQ